MKVEWGERVTFTDKDGIKHTGRVTSVEPWRCNIKTDGGRLFKRVPLVRLRVAKDKVLMLETRLSSDLRSKRGDGAFFDEFFRVHGVPWLYERIHTKDDLAYFLGRARRDPDVRWVHYLGHGKLRGSRRRCQFNLTAGRVLLPEDLKVFAGLGGKTLVLSCCWVGGCTGILDALRETSDAQAVFAYNGDVYDHQTRMGDTILYETMLSQPSLTPQQVADIVNEALRSMWGGFEGLHRLLTVATR